MRIKAGVLIVSLFFLSLASFPKNLIFTRLQTGTGLSSNFVNCVWQDRQGFMWIGTENGLQRYDGNHFAWITTREDETKIPPLPVDQILGSDDPEYMWVRLGTLVGRFYPETGVYTPANLPKEITSRHKIECRLMIVDSQKVILVVPALGLYRYKANSNSFENILSKEDASKIGLRSAAEDNHLHMLYLCGDNGISAFDYKTNKLLSPQGLPENMLLKASRGMKNIVGILIDGEGYRVIRQQPGKIPESLLIDAETGRTAVHSLLANSSEAQVANCSWTAGGDDTWIYGSNLLNMYDTKAHAFRKVLEGIDGKNSIEFSVVKQVFADADKNTWIATDNGLYIAFTIGDYISYGTLGKEQNRFNECSTSASINLKDIYNAPIISAYRDNKNLTWVATAGRGVVVLNEKHALVKTFDQHGGNGRSLMSDFTRAITQVNDSIYIVAGEHNLNIVNYNSGSIKHITTNNGLPNNTVYTLQTDLRKQVWMSTNNGIVKYDYERDNFKVYDNKEGLVTVSNLNDLLYKSCRLTDGTIAFSGDKRYIMFHPDSIYERSFPKDVTITNIRLFNELLPVDSINKENGLRLRYDQNAIAINFTSLNFAINRKLNYYYKLEGIDEEWIRADRFSSASYASLPPGKYVFKVRCVNSIGQMSRHETHLNIMISAPFWQTWWFAALILCAIVIPVVIIYQLRIKRFQAVQKLREKVARDLHDDVGSTLTSINILSEMSIERLGANGEVREYLGRIRNNSGQMMDAMDDIVWNIKPANDTMSKIIARMREYAASVFEPQEIMYKFVNEDVVKHLSLNMDVRRSLLLIFKEALNNIVKYAEASLVTIDFKIDKGNLHMDIRDNGKGFDMEKVRYGNGIENMNKRAVSFNGTIDIKSLQNVGTRVEISIPIKKSQSF